MSSNYMPQHSGCARLRPMQTSARPRPSGAQGAIGRLFTWIRELHRSWYHDELARNRRMVEETARRFGGRVTWDDVQ
jgi:hypothetical protein